MKPRTKFLIGGALVIGTAGYLAASARQSVDRNGIAVLQKKCQGRAQLTACNLSFV